MQVVELNGCRRKCAICLFYMQVCCLQRGIFLSVVCLMLLAIESGGQSERWRWWWAWRGSSRWLFSSRRYSAGSTSSATGRCHPASATSSTWRMRYSTVSCRCAPPTCLTSLQPRVLQKRLNRSRCRLVHRCKKRWRKIKTLEAIKTWWKRSSRVGDWRRRWISKIT